MLFRSIIVELLQQTRKFSIHAPLAGRDEQAGIFGVIFDISIHAPLAGRDSYRGNACQYAKHFNPRAPRGARPFFFDVLLGTVKFQSTRPSRGATLAPPLRIGTPENFNPRAPRGARPVTKPMPLRRAIFQSTRPSRGATANVHKNHVHICANTQKKYVFLSNTVCQSA